MNLSPNHLGDLFLKEWHCVRLQHTIKLREVEIMSDSGLFGRWKQNEIKFLKK